VSRVHDVSPVHGGARVDRVRKVVKGYFASEANGIDHDVPSVRAIIVSALGIPRESRI